MAKQKAETVPTPEAKTPDERYRAFLRERIIINARRNKIDQDLKTLHERNLVIEGALGSLENEHSFDRKTVGDEVLKSIQAEQEAAKAGK